MTGYSVSNILIKNYFWGKWNKLNWDLHPISTIHSEKKKENRLFCWLQQNEESLRNFEGIIRQPGEL